MPMNLSGGSSTQFFPLSNASATHQPNSLKKKQKCRKESLHFYFQCIWTHQLYSSRNSSLCIKLKKKFIYSLSNSNTTTYIDCCYTFAWSFAAFIHCQRALLMLSECCDIVALGWVRIEMLCCWPKVVHDLPLKNTWRS